MLVHAGFMVFRQEARWRIGGFVCRSGELSFSESYIYASGFEQKSVSEVG